MAIIFSDVGEVNLLDALLRNSNGENFTLKLYKTSVTPTQSSTAGSFTEADFTGYTSKTLTRSSFTAASTSSNKATTSYAVQTWTASSSQTIYGWYLVGATSGTLIAAELFSTARSLTSGDTLSITFSALTLNSES